MVPRSSRYNSLTVAISAYLSLLLQLQVIPKISGLWVTLITVVPANPRLFRRQKAGCGAWFPVAGPPRNSASGVRTFMPLMGGKPLYGPFCFLRACCWVAHFCRKTPPLSHHHQRPHSSPVIHQLWTKAMCCPYSQYAGFQYYPWAKARRSLWSSLYTEHARIQHFGWWLYDW